MGWGSWVGLLEDVDWVSSISVFFLFFSVFLWSGYMHILFTHSYVTIALQVSLLVLFLTTFHIPHPFTGFAASTYLSRIIICSTIHHQYSLAPFFGLLFPHIISTYHIVTTAMNSVCIFSSAFLCFFLFFFCFLFLGRQLRFTVVCILKFR